MFIDRQLLLIDIEATGNSSKDSSIIQLGALKLDCNFNVDETFCRFIKPYKSEWTQEAFGVHGIAKEYLQLNGKDIKETLIDFENLLGDRINKYYIAQWGSGFDSDILLNAYNYCERPYPFSYRTYDIASFVRLYLGAKGKISKNTKIGLVSCAELLGAKVDRDKAHDAVYDCILARECLIRIYREIINNG